MLIPNPKTAKRSSSKLLLIILGCLLLIAVLTVAIVVGLYRAQFSGSFSIQNGDWGTFGDYIGGTLNPLFALLTVFGLSATLVLQWLSLQSTQKEVTRADFMRRFEAEEANLELLAMDTTKNLMIHIESENDLDGEQKFSSMLESYSKGERNIFLNKLKAFFVIGNIDKIDKLTKFADCGYGLQVEQYVQRYARLLQDAKSVGDDIFYIVNFRVSAKLYDAMLPHYKRNVPNFQG